MLRVDSFGIFRCNSEELKAPKLENNFFGGKNVFFGIGTYRSVKGSEIALDEVSATEGYLEKVQG